MIYPSTKLNALKVSSINKSMFKNQLLPNLQVLASQISIQAETTKYEPTMSYHWNYN